MMTEQVARPRRASQRAPLSGVRALVVDDDEDARILLATVLEVAGATVAQASSAAEALEALQAEPFAVLVSDIGMPFADGYDLIRSIRSSAPPMPREIPAVAVTAFCAAADRLKARSAGFQEHLAKPLDSARLIEVVQGLVAAH